MKVSGSGLRDLFREVVVVEGDKVEVIEYIAQRDHFLPETKVVFADNRCGHFVGAQERGIITVHLKRPGDKYSKASCAGCQYVVENFDELSQVLKNL
jgi:FMN phosphatase YigB (HAD superfamily)